MKQIILLSSFFFCFNSVMSAQNEFAPIGAYWKYYYYSSFGDERQRLVKVVADTLVNGQNFKKLAVEEYVISRYPVLTTSRGYDSEFLSTRNDSVFMGLNQLFLFNFKAQLGDSIKLRGALNGRTRFCIVDSVGQINLGGINRRIMYFTKYCQNKTNGQTIKYPKISKLVDNVGLLTEGLIWDEPDCGVFDVSQYLFSCYNSPTFRVPANVTCAPTVSTNELIQSQIAIFPNPANNELTINFPSELQLKSGELMNYLGQKMRFNTLENNQKIDVSNWPNGAYFLRLLFDNQSVTKKILILH
jgi:hypothetical protein